MPKRRSWRVICPDGRIRDFPSLTKKAACESAFQKSVDGHRRFPDDPRRWWRRRCPQGKHLAHLKRPR